MCQDIYKAIISENLEEIKRIISENKIFDPNAGHKSLHSPFLAACMRGNLDIIKYFVENTNANYKDPMAINCAAMENHIDVVKYFVEELNVDPHFNNEILFHYAAEFGALDVVKYLLELNIDISTCGYRGYLYAILNNHQEIAKLLQGKGASLKKIRDSGEWHWKTLWKAHELAQENNLRDSL